MASSDVIVVDSSAASTGSGDMVRVSVENKAYGGDADSTFSNIDPPVIVGAACRLPGDIHSPSALWDFMVEKKSAQGPIPPERYNIDGFYDKVSRSGTTNVPGGYFINEDVRDFDNTFFGINNLEATYMDPQQRKLLEVVYECLASAGTTMESVSGSNTGVYVANFSVDYQPLMIRDPDYLHRYISTGSGATIMSNRISHIFNLHGPSFTIDTACSSSIYALHQALNAMKASDCESVIVASSNLMLSPELHVAAAKSGVLSPTGTCHTFDASADGYGRAEGINAVYIKRLSAALRDGNPIRAVIRGSAVNASGRTPGIALPSGKLQEVVMRKAYTDAGLDFTGTDYVECHGTGTNVGDPIEVDSVGRCFSPREGPPLLIGSVKTNVGHSEGASGLTSILKVMQAFEKGKIPPSQGIVKLNPKLILKERNLKVAQEVEDWPRALRRASINSFGYGGANAHVVLECPKSYLGEDYQVNFGHANEDSETQEEGKLVVLPLSASSPKALETLVQQITKTVTQIGDEKTLQSLAHTLTKGRDHMRQRSFVLAKMEGSSGKVVEEMADGPLTKPTADSLPYGFVFTGQGAQYAGMAKELLLKSQHFRDTIHRLDAVLQALPKGHAPDWTLEQTILLDAAESRINEVTRSQPICTAVQVGIIDLLRTWNVQPTYVVGHSSGEIAAAYAAGLLTSTQAILAAYFRGFAVGDLTSKGAMMAAGLAPEAAKLLIEDKGLVGQVRVACVNSPESVTLSGTPDGIEALREHLQGENKFARKLETGGRAYHSHMMEEIGQRYEDLLAPFFTASNGPTAASASEAGIVTMFSSVGHGSENLKVLDSQTYFPAYWRENLEQPVQFSGALANLLAAGKKAVHLVEIGPHAALKGPIKQIRTGLGLKEEAVPYSPTLVRGKDADFCLKALSGALFTNGLLTLNWDAVNSLPESGLRTLYDLAPYPWDYSRGLLWSEPRASAEMRRRKYVRHELLGTQALTGNGIDYTWRNLLRLSETPWLRDHKLEDQIVFPATGYMAIAIEAVLQVTDSKKKPADQLAFEFRNVNISAALNIPDEERDIFSIEKDLEVHTTMSPRKISTANRSVDWYDFSVSSWLDGNTTVHCTGSIRLDEPRKASSGVKLQSTDSFDTWPTSRWYKKWHEEGLCFGPTFQSLNSLRTDAGRGRREAIGVTRLQPPVARESTTYYPVHPITIDAVLQTSILSTTAGHMPSLKTWLPVFIGECRIQPPQGGLVADANGEVGSQFEVECEIHSRSEETGLSSRKIDSTLWDSHGVPVVDFKGGRMALYNGKTTPVDATNGDNPANKFAQREPTLRVRWKPDVLRLRPETESRLKKYVAEFVDQQPDDVRDDETLAIIGTLLDLAGHKNPRMRVLELEGDAFGYKAKQWQSMLDKDTSFSRCRSWDTATMADGKVSVEGEGGEGPFDVLLVPTHAASKRFWDEMAGHIEELVSEHGVVITRKSESAVAELKFAGFEVLDVGKKILLAKRPLLTTDLTGRNALIVRADNASPAVTDLANALATHLQKKAGVSRVSIIKLSQLDNTKIAESDICVSLLETEAEFLATMSPQNMNRLRAMTDKATDLLWLTGANMLGSSPDPNLTLSSGLSRSLMLEQPTLRWSVVDVGELQALDVATACDNALKALVVKYDKDDCEFIEKNGVLYVSRYGPDFGVNSLFRQRVGLQQEKQTRTLAELGSARLAIDRVGVMDTLHFQEVSEPGSGKGPAAGHVDIQVKAVGLNAKDVQAMAGRLDGRGNTTAFDFSGVVTAVGKDVDNVQVGDRVAAFAPHHLGTTVTVPARSVLKMLDHEEFSVVPTLLLVYGTALYALNERAKLRPGETILIHAGSGGLGIAAITLAQRLGAVVYTTVGSQAKRDYLINKLGVLPSHIFSSRDASFVPGIMKATGGRGADVVVNSLVGDLMHESWRCLANFGRFVELGKRELVDVGKLDMGVFLRNTTFTALDLSELYYAEDPYYRAIWDRLMAETLDLYRSNAIQPLPTKVFDASQVVEAYRYFADKERVGKVVISMEDQHSRVPVKPATYLSVFDSEKVYLMIGCLGGLGRSLSRWMMQRGARHFVFLGRSGADKPSARQLVTRLEEAGATVEVVRGDVSQAEHVTASVEACINSGRRIGGIIQAAMGLHEALFTRMPNEAWHTGIAPKWQGTWNLQNALQVHVDKDKKNEPDFFLLTSSVSGTVGTATESNYCSANGFLDAFAHWRRSRGQACVSIGLGMISEVGYLHENPEIEALLLRKGIQPLNEEEMLQVVDLALSSEPRRSMSEAHMLTGLEPAAIRELTAKGFDVTTHGVLVEARASVLLASLLAEKEASESPQQGAAASAVASAAPWFKEIPAALSATFAPEADAETRGAAILRLVKSRFSNLILMATDQIGDTSPLPSFGVDSMIASEFRSWFWSAFRVDIPFLEIMSPQTSVAVLAEKVDAKLSAPAS
ncbi:polyketide synthase [Sodiomyces alkalinus F11]|uniref:Polyketide synthase n=1 Tax=Sodiomyces alkalinus (strain CBS 110278 / VKM F-3762 / F11) TaxID=1314773 RepID=A0A3N2PWP4_SODAK|nr:polyketide synthase [Sodiomyces alkalinus F11]ROT38902.1 polyketide synthase [Sodiomyces alkalinus F11]